VYRPCRRALRLPTGAPLPGAPPCILQRRRPRTAGDWHGFPFRVRAWHRAAWFMHDGPWCMGLILTLRRCPTPWWTAPTIACPPWWTWTCSTVTFCWPLPRCRFRASRSTAKLRIACWLGSGSRAGPRMSVRRSLLGASTPSRRYMSFRKHAEEPIQPRARATPGASRDTLVGSLRSHQIPSFNLIDWRPWCARMSQHRANGRQKASFRCRFMNGHDEH